MKNSILIFLFFWIFSTPLIAQTLQWANSTKSTSSTTDLQHHIKLDQDENIYVAGSFKYLLTFSNSDLELSGVGGVDIYLSKLSPSGELLWARAFGGVSQDDIYDMAIDNEGNIYLVGRFHMNIAVGTGGNSISLTSNGQRDGFLVKFSSTGNLLAAHQIGGDSKDDITAITFDNEDNLILAGQFIGEVDFDLSQETHIVQCSGLTFVKYTKELEFISAHTLSSPHSFITKLEVNAENELIFGGYFADYVTLPSGEGITDCGGSCGFLMKLSNTFEFKWVAGITGGNIQKVSDMQITPSGDIYVAGQFTHTSDFTSNSATQTFESNSNSNDIFFAKISSTGSFEWVKTMGSTGNDNVTGIELDNQGNIILVGGYASTIDFDTGPNTALYTNDEYGPNSFISTYTANGDYLNTFIFENSDGNAASGIALSSNDEVYLTGWFDYFINFDQTQPGFEFSSLQRHNYLLKMSAVTVGMDDAHKAPPISIFPNPAQDEVHIEVPHIQKLEVYNIHGKLILSKAAMAFSDRQTLEISHLPAGTYIVRLTANGGFIRAEKFVITR